jgi:hypothetical protein
MTTRIPMKTRISALFAIASLVLVLTPSVSQAQYRTQNNSYGVSGGNINDIVGAIVAAARWAHRSEAPMERYTFSATIMCSLVRIKQLRVKTYRNLD